MLRRSSMVRSRHCRSFIEARSLMCPLPFEMTSQEARRYRAWQRMERKIRRLDNHAMRLRIAIIRRYNEELAAINADEGAAAGFSRGSGGEYQFKFPFEEERHRRS